MHENIKFTIRLDPKIKPIKDIKLARKERGRDLLQPGKFEPVPVEEKEETGDWQPIYAYAAYGTDFVVYAKFLIDDPATAADSGSGDGTEISISGIQLYVQNYIGPVTIGFNDAKVRIDHQIIDEGMKDGDPRYKERKQYRLFIGLQGLRNDVKHLFKTKNSDFTVLEDPRSDFLHKQGRENFAVESATHSDYVPFTSGKIKLKEGDTLYVESWFSPADPGLTRIYESREHILDSPFVDLLFMERIGEDIVVTHKGMDELEWIHREFANENIVTKDQLNAALENGTESLRTYISPRGKTGDADPCEKAYSRFHTT